MGAIQADKDRLLDPLGLSELDEVVYRGLLETPTATLTELSARNGVRRDRLAHALGRLEENGLLSRIPGRPRRYAAANPEAAIEALLHAHEERIARVRSGIDGLTATFQMARHRQQQAVGLVEVVRGESAVAQRFAHLQRQVSHEMLLIDRPPYASPSPQNPLEEEALRRGVTWRTLYAPESLEAPGQPEEVRRLVALGEQARTHPHVPLKLAIIDHATALIPLNSANTNTNTNTNTQLVVVHASALLDALVELFELCWAQGLPLGAETNEQEQLTDEEHRLLTLLIAGLKDDAIARQLNISPRTMGRRMSKLCERLGARTRFQAGYQAARRVWT